MINLISKSRKDYHKKEKHRASELKLKSICRRKHVPRSQIHQEKKSGFSKAFNEQQTPQQKIQQEDYQQNIFHYSAIEDTRISRFTSNKIILVQKQLLILTLLIFFIGMTKAATDLQFKNNANSSQALMNILTSSHAVLILLLFHRRLLYMQLDIDQRNVYIKKRDRNKCELNAFNLLSDYQNLGWITLQIILALPHPNILTHGLYFTSYYEGSLHNDLYFSYNDLLGVMMIFKIYIILRCLVQLTTYASPRANRLCRLNNLQHSFFYSLKCLQYDYPLLSSVVLLGFLTIVFAYAFRLSQGNFYYANMKNGKTIPDLKRGFQQLGNCFYFVFTTMMTIGYGDYVPVASLSKFLAILLCIIGAIFNSFFVVALLNYLQFKINQIRSHTTLTRLRMYSKLQKTAATILVETVQVRQQLDPNNLDPLVYKKLKPMFNIFKQKIDQVKTYHKKIKNTLPTDNNAQQMIRQFTLIKDSFRQFYVQQKKIRDRLDLIDTQMKNGAANNVRNSFMAQVAAFSHQ